MGIERLPLRYAGPGILAILWWRRKYIHLRSLAPGTDNHNGTNGSCERATLHKLGSYSPSLCPQPCLFPIYLPYCDQPLPETLRLVTATSPFSLNVCGYELVEHPFFISSLFFGLQAPTRVLPSLSPLPAQAGLKSPPVFSHVVL